VDLIEWLSIRIGDFEMPFLAWPEFAIDIPEDLARKHRGLSPGRFVVRQIRAYIVSAWLNLVDMEKVSRHA
jgi:hypothetical protein